MRCGSVHGLRVVFKELFRDMRVTLYQLLGYLTCTFVNVYHLHILIVNYTSQM